MKHFHTFESFLNEAKKMNDYENSRNIILVGLKTNLLRDMLDRYEHEEDGDSIHFFDKKGNHFATLFDRGTRYQEISIAKSARMGPGAACVGLVAPSTWRTASTALLPRHAIATTGADTM